MINILDCTIRDGSYATNYQWDNEVLVSLVSGLSRAGIPYIEVGNGTGLGMYRKVNEAKPDQEYFTHTIKYKNNSKIGVFFIPSIGSYDDILNFKNEGGDFIRIGINATETQQAIPYIEYAKQLGLEVFCNLMKTYAISVYQLAFASAPLINAGVDCIYIVDSAGGMTPQQVQDYFSAMHAIYDISLGFHGHNNLLMANANSYMAVRSGATFVDATLMSLGRGAGNAQIESLVALFQKTKMLREEIDVNMLCNLSDDIIHDIRKDQKANTRRNIVIGAANFHDSYLPIAEKYAQKYCINTEVLITEVSKVNMVNPSEDLFNLIASKIVNNTVHNIHYPKFCHKKY